MEGNAPEICMPPYYNTGTVFDYGKGAMSFCGAVKVLGTAKFNDSEISVENQTETTLFISLRMNRSLMSTKKIFRHCLTEWLSISAVREPMCRQTKDLKISKKAQTTTISLRFCSNTADI